MQRLLACCDKIFTVSEPWLLFPHCYALKKEGIYTEYNHGWAQSALIDFIDRFPKKEEDYFLNTGKMALALYNEIAPPQARYFLDKTPRYYLIISEIAMMFPKAKFIFLFRNPVQVLASIIDSINRNRMRLNEYHVDLFRGPDLLAEGIRNLKDVAISVNFDDLVMNPDAEMHRIADYLEIDADHFSLKNLPTIKLDGPMGDKDGYRLKGTVDQNTTEKWKTTLGTSFRKKFAEKYIRSLNEETLEIFGCQRDELIQSIRSIKRCHENNFRDQFDYYTGKIISLLELSMFIKQFKNRKLTKGLSSMHR